MKTLGLMGLGFDGTLYAPSGARICRLPIVIAGLIQRAQHAFARAWNELLWGLT